MADYKFDTVQVIGRPGYKLSFLSLLKGAGNTGLPNVTFVASDVKIIVRNAGAWVMRNITTPPADIGGMGIYAFDISGADLQSDSPESPMGVFVIKTVGVDSAFGFISIVNPLADSGVGLMEAIQEMLSYCTGVITRNTTTGENMYVDRSGNPLFYLTPTLPARTRREFLPPVVPTIDAQLYYYSNLGESLSIGWDL